MKNERGLEGAVMLWRNGELGTIRMRWQPQYQHNCRERGCAVLRKISRIVAVIGR